MTHYYLDYSKLSEPFKTKKALKDFKDHVGPNAYKALVELTAQKPRPFVQGWMENIMGVRGFPVNAFLDTYYPTTSRRS